MSKFDFETLIEIYRIMQRIDRSTNRPAHVAEVRAHCRKKGITALTGTTHRYMRAIRDGIFGRVLGGETLMIDMGGASLAHADVSDKDARAAVEGSSVTARSAGAGIDRSALSNAMRQSRSQKVYSDHWYSNGVRTS